MNINHIGHFPVEGAEARETGEIVKITQENWLKTIVGKENPLPMNFFVSNDVVHFGILKVPARSGLNSNSYSTISIRL